MDRTRSVNVTVSQGIAVVSPSMNSHADLIKAAEGALVEARSAGFDQVRVVEPPPTAATPAA
jgi:PleD family two-component response regulator